MTDVLGTASWSLSPRFLLRQGEDAKIRIIDDLKASSVKQAFGSSSYLELQDTDFTVGLLRFISRSLQCGERVRIPLSDGSLMEGELCPEMRGKPALLGKTLDLSKAYRQVAVHPQSRKHAVLGFPGPSGQWQYFIARSLPFGATASVYAFNKLALGILHILVVIATDFYDDFTLFEFQPAASLMDKVAMRLLSELGWTFAREGKKFVPFAKVVVSLGVSLDLSDVWVGSLTIANKPGRLEKIASVLRPIADGEEVTRADLASLHGLINFAGGYVMGFELKPTARMLAKALSGPFRGNTKELSEICRLALDILSQCAPRQCLANVRPPLIVYTDGAYEGEVGSWGSLAIDPTTGLRWLFGGRIEEGLVRHWRECAGEQVICQVEAYAFAVTLFGIRVLAKQRTLIVFIDNEPCRLGFIRRSSPSAAMMSLISLVSLLEGALSATLWYERVPSKSNPADLPSRGLMSEAAKKFNATAMGDLPRTEVLRDFLKTQAYNSNLARAMVSAMSVEAEALLC